MNGKKYFLLIAFVSLLFSCSKGMQNDNECKKLIFKNNKFELCDSMDFKFIPLETTEKCLIGLISDIKIVDDKIFIGDIYKSNAVFVFDLNGKFITKVGERGSGSKQYIDLFGFDFNKEKRLICLDDRHRNRLLFYDLDSFQHKYTLNVDFNYSNFHFLKNSNIAFFSYQGFKNDITNDKSYLLIADSTGKAINRFYDCTFSTSQTLSNMQNRIYTLQNNSFVFHHLFPFVYKIEDTAISPVYEIIFETFKFPTLAYLEENSAGNDQYIDLLDNSDLVSSYGIYETSNLICCPFVRKKQLYIGLYNKQSDNGYLFTVPDFYRESRLGALIDPIGYTEDYVIAKVDPQDVCKVKNNSILSYLSEKVTEEDNPILCLFKWKYN